ncbi:GerAB/ArcD/ProY family transporter [Alteribacillus bidgolensis]|uniref:Spore germination protein n=1 Tax=Alteribacillus bidgolensis TaxID=930129 RepID=A0A1G8ECZ8_9BACI|nr:endospore germination permease [Alteribacillus bidgolensis]SDH67805.1 spore germination protein [Alteribacillus bidgolensis]
MKPFEYGDQEIGEKDFIYIIPSFTIAIVILTIPNTLAKVTNFVDGWVSLIMAGMCIVFFTAVIAKLAARFPKETFFTYASKICSKPVAVVLTILLGVHFLLLAAYEVRYVSVIARQYLLERTPGEIISLLFLLVVVYAVSGSRVGVIRLNLLFLPIIVFIALLVTGMNLVNFDFKNLSPFFTTSWKGYLSGAEDSLFALSGFEILFFYIALVDRPKKVQKYAMIGACIPLGLYLVIYTVAIGVFSAETTGTIIYPTIELAKAAEVPGGFLGRFESLFFTIWSMAIFNTASLAYDAALIAAGSLFKQVKKITFIFILTPIVYLIAMFPKDLIEISTMERFMSYSFFLVGILLPTSLLLLAKVRGIKGNG